MQVQSRPRRFPFVLKAILLCALLFGFYIKEKNLAKTYAVGIIHKNDISYLITTLSLN